MDVVPGLMIWSLRYITIYLFFRHCSAVLDFIIDVRHKKCLMQCLAHSKHFLNNHTPIIKSAHLSNSSLHFFKHPDLPTLILKPEPPLYR